jgi:hypothetical protein
LSTLSFGSSAARGLPDDETPRQNRSPSTSSTRDESVSPLKWSDSLRELSTRRFRTLINASSLERPCTLPTRHTPGVFPWGGGGGAYETLAKFQPYLIF